MGAFGVKRSFNQPRKRYGDRQETAKSPWASSEVLITMYYGLTPAQRGLVEQEDLPIFTFPPNYISRLWGAIEAVNPEFAENLQAFKEAQTGNAN